MQAIKDWLYESSVKLSQANISTARLDAEVILAAQLNQNRTYLHAHPEFILTDDSLLTLNNLIEQRLKHIPIAYLLGYKEFYGREFQVTNDTLIPRPESETIIEILKKIDENNPRNQTLVDVGTGSGCLGITAKLECPNLDVIVSDVSKKALAVAGQNAQELSASITIVQSSLLDNINQKINTVIANLPYVDKSWERSPETDHEPALALFADDDGKALIKKLITQASTKIAIDGFIIIEADPEQHADLIAFAKQKSFKLFIQKDYIIALKYSN